MINADYNIIKASAGLPTEIIFIGALLILSFFLMNHFSKHSKSKNKKSTENEPNINLKTLNDEEKKERFSLCIRRLDSELCHFTCKNTNDQKAINEINNSKPYFDPEIDASFIEKAEYHLLNAESYLQRSAQQNQRTNETQAKRYYLLGKLSEMFMRNDEAEEYFKLYWNFFENRDISDQNPTQKIEPKREKIENVEPKPKITGEKKDYIFTDQELETNKLDYGKFKTEDLQKISLQFKELTVKHIENNDHEKVIEFADQIVEIERLLSKKEPDKHMPNFADTLSNAANINQEYNNKIKAIQLHEEATNIYRELMKDNREDYQGKFVESLMNLGTSHYANDDTVKEIETLKEALDNYKILAEGEIDNPHQIGLVKCLTSLAISYTHLNNYQQAITYHLESLQTRRRLNELYPDEYLPQISQTLHDLGNSYNNIKNIKKSVQYFQEALEIRQKLAKESPQDYLEDFAKTLNDLGTSYWSNDNFKEGIKYLEKSREIKRQAYIAASRK